ncbi:hypothetical protein SAY87_000245 [Trapa incisa]|uniref:Glycosyl-hydrolase family 116 catalytic region domain-containing protein n=1 Tax=Trapa incisa TaxID=236973 RepID=A0AAN7GRD5_9MYRT|nr:hypothetical protein SAY87_000245 [Trapa incisa]
MMFTFIRLLHLSCYSPRSSSANPDMMKIMCDGKWVPGEFLGAVPHKDPWFEINAYDLFSLCCNCLYFMESQIYAQVQFGRAVCPSVYAAIAYMDQFDKDGDGMI